jgi:hypothetical protein
MKKPSHRDRLLAALPADLQAGAMEACQAFSCDGNDPIEGMFAADIESTQRGFADQREANDRSTAQLREEIRSLREKLATADEKLRAKLAESEDRDKQLPAHITKCHTETRETVRKEVGKLGQDQFWRRVLVSKVAGGITLAVCWVVGSYWLINSQIGAVKSSVDQLKAGQTETLSEISDNPQGIVDFATASLRAADKSNDTAAMLGGIAAMLKTPDATMGMRDGQLTLKLKSDHITVKQEDDYTYLRIHDEMPPILDRVEDHLDDADRALQRKPE